MKQTDIAYNTRKKVVRKLSDHITAMSAIMALEIRTLNADSSRPIHQVNDLAGTKVGREYLNAPEHSAENEWAIQLGRLLQDVKQLERRILRVEASAKR